MEKYREKLKFQVFLTAIGVIALAAVSILGFTGILKPVAGDSHWVDMWNGFLSGASCGLLGMMLFFLVRDIVALCNDKVLKKVYVKDKDERSEKIWVYARSAALQTFLMVGIVAAIVAGYFSIPISITILACTLFPSIVGFFFSFYYSVKF